MKVEFTLKYHTDDTLIKSVIDRLIDTSLLFDINIQFNLLKDVKYDRNKIDITPSFYSNEVEEISQNYLDFHSYYLETYVHNENINIDLISVNQH